MDVVVAGGGNSSYIPPTIQTTPERPSINVPFKVSSLVTTGSTTFAIATDGKLYGWGDNYCNVLTLGETPYYTDIYDRNPFNLHSSTPYHISEVGKVKSLKISGDTAYAITEDGKLYAWGSNYYGQVGNGRSGYNAEQTTPYEVTSIIGKVKSLKISGSTVYAITEEGKLYAWGNNKYGQVGNGSTGTQTIPYEVTGIVGKVKSIETDGSTAYAITEEGKLYAWGDNYYGQVGNGSTTNQTTPYEVTSIVGKVKSLKISGDTAYAITEEGKLYAWGDDEYGKVGNGRSDAFEDQTTPYELTSIVGKVKSLKVGVKVYNGDYLYTVYAITEEGKLYAWGYNGYGEVGNGSTGTQTTPYEVTSIVGKVKSVIGGYTVYAITEEGKLYAWGDNDYGQVGNGSTGTQTIPYELTSVGKVKSVEIYSSTVYVITEEGKLYAWGYNKYGEVGNGSTGGTQTIPYELTSIVGKVKSVVTNDNTVYAITEDNRLYAWGGNFDGQVGNGYYDDTVTTPYYISEVKQFLE